MRNTRGIFSLGGCGMGVHDMGFYLSIEFDSSTGTSGWGVIRR